MTERYERDDFRLWLTAFEADEQPFQERCPIATWQKDDPGFKLYFESLSSDWMAKFIVRVDEDVAFRESDGKFLNDWSTVTAKEAIGILDGIDL